MNQKSHDNIDFKECEQIDESWHNEVQSKTKRIELLEGDLKKLKKLLSSNRNFNETEGLKLVFQNLFIQILI